MTKTILISGASVAGPALAWWLHHHGFRATVVERAPSLREGGYKVDIRGVAVDVVRRMGLLEQVHAASTDMRGAAFVDKRGKPRPAYKVLATYVRKFARMAARRKAEAEREQNTPPAVITARR